MKNKILKLFLSFLCVFCFISCGTPESQIFFENQMKLFQNEPAKSLTRKDLSSEEKALLKFFEKMTYEINNVKEKKDSSTINITLKVANLNYHFPELVEIIIPLVFSFKSEEDINKTTVKFYEDLAKREDLSYLYTTIDVEMEKVNNEWAIKNEDTLIKAISSGVNKCTLF